nr:biotin transporter BioY [Baekduia sp.]
MKLIAQADVVVALGSRLGALSQAAYVLAGAMGLAVFAPSATLPPGLLRLAGPTGGYLLAYPLAAFVAGYLAERGWGRNYVSAVGAMLAGLAVICIGGVSWLAIGFTVYDVLRYQQALEPFVQGEVRVVLDRLAGSVAPERAGEMMEAGTGPVGHLLGAMYTKLLSAELQRVRDA